MFLQLLFTGNDFKFPCIQLTSQIRSRQLMSVLKYKQFSMKTHHSLDLELTFLELSPQIVKNLFLQVHLI